MSYRKSSRRSLEQIPAWRPLQIIEILAIVALCVTPYLGLSGSVLSNASAAPAFSIRGKVANSGGVAVPDVLIMVSSGGSNVFTTTASGGDQAGTYEVTGLTGGLDYTVTPSKAGFTFSPQNRVFADLNANQINADFVASTGAALSVSGRVVDSGNNPIVQVLIRASGSDGSQISTTTSEGGDNPGSYALTLTGGVDYTITPSKAGFSFNPQNRVFANLSGNQADVNFVGTTGQGLSISGKVETSTGAAISDVLIRVTGSDGSQITTTTAAGSGTYQLTGLTTGLSYTVTPSRAGFSFNPQSRAFPTLAASQTDVNFVGTIGQLSIRGRVVDRNSVPMGNVLIHLTGSDGTQVTAATASGGENIGSYEVTGLAGGLTYTVTPSLTGFVFTPSNLVFPNLSSSITDANFTEGDPTPLIQFNANSFTFDESSNFGAITVTRSGDTSSPATVKYATSDATDVNFNCNPATQGQIAGAASRKCDYHIAAGRVRFAAGESSKQIILSLVNDVYVEGTEVLNISLSNPTGGVLGAFSMATINITDNDLAGGQPNPINATPFYVRMLYVDLLSREPDPNGFAAWVHRIDFCGQPGEPPPPCDRVTVGGDGFMRSAEFFDRQFFVIKLYRSGLGRILRYEDVADLAYVSGFLTDADLELNKQELVTDIMSRTEFSNLYNGLSNASYVDLLIQTAAVTIPQSVRDGWVTALGNSSKTRAGVYRELSERPEVNSRYLHEAQVVSCYYAFFTRNPDAAYLNFLDRLDRGEINLGDLANAFINASEYRQRFGP